MLTLTGGSHHPGKLIQEEHCVLGLGAKAVEGLTLTGGSHHPGKLIQEEHCVLGLGAKAIEGLTLTGGSHHPGKLIQEEHCVLGLGAGAHIDWWQSPSQQTHTGRALCNVPREGRRRDGGDREGGAR